MSRKHVVLYTVFDAVQASDPQLSSVTNVAHLDGCAYHVKFDAPATGTFKVQARSADLKITDGDVAWFDLGFGKPLTISGELDVQLILTMTPFKEIRLVWEPTSASGLLNVYMVMKTVGA